MDDIKLVCVDDEDYVVESIKDYFTSSVDARIFTNPVTALKHLKADRTDILIADYRMPDKNGLELLIEAKKDNSYSKAVLLTAYAEKDLLKEVINRGLIDVVVEKPLNLPDLEEILNGLSSKIKEERAAKKEEERLKEVYRLLSADNFDFNFIGKKGDLKHLWEQAVSVAPTDENVLITGETGTGKDVLAKQIHMQSLRADKAFIKINCGAIPAPLIESELFGYEKGAFSGAGRQKPGKIELARGGTLFLDEIGELPLELQTRLLHVVEDKTLERVGGITRIPVDFRLISATNKNLADEDEGCFRRDLFFRISTVHLSLPPLSQRSNDLPILILSLLKKNIRRFDKPEYTLSIDAMRAMSRSHWPGNIRELDNVVKQIILLKPENEKVITEEDFFTYCTGCISASGFDDFINAAVVRILENNESLLSIEQSILAGVLENCSGKVMEASRRSGIPKDRFYRMQEKRK